MLNSFKIRIHLTFDVNKDGTPTFCKFCTSRLNLLIKPYFIIRTKTNYQQQNSLKNIKHPLLTILLMSNKKRREKTFSLHQ